MSRAPSRNDFFCLTEEEKQQVVAKFGSTLKHAAKSMHMSQETYKNIMAPGGRSTEKTIQRIRALISS